MLLLVGSCLPQLAISPIVRREPTLTDLRTEPWASRKESCQENVSQIRKPVLLTINLELIHATLEAIRYSRRTVRGICAARIPGEEKEREVGRAERGI